MAGCEITSVHYRTLLQRVREAGYTHRLFSQGEPEPGVRTFYMRHDIDIDPFAALDMARIEAEHGVRATYFFLPTSYYYNLWAPNARAALREIEALGGDVQLHFDAAPFAELELSMIEDEIEKQAAMLGDIVGGKDIRAVSFHRPAPSLFARDLQRMTSTYAPRYFHGMHYISDSAGMWRDGCVCNLLGKSEVIHCLIHPIWWGERAASVSDTLRNYLVRNAQVLDACLRSEIRSYANANPTSAPAVMPAA